MTDDEWVALALNAGAGLDLEALWGDRAMPAPCVDCPFKLADEDRPYLTRGRMAGIVGAVLIGQMFPCHKTVYSPATVMDEDPETGEQTAPRWAPHYRQCHGALDWVARIKAGEDPLANMEEP